MLSKPFFPIREDIGGTLSKKGSAIPLKLFNCKLFVDQTLGGPVRAARSARTQVSHVLLILHIIFSVPSQHSPNNFHHLPVSKKMAEDAEASRGYTYGLV